MSKEEALRILAELAAERRETFSEEARGQVRGLVLANRGIKGAYLDLVQIDWEGMFKQNKCPQCSGTLTLTGDRYLCGTCLIEIPVALYDAAEKEWESDTALQEEEATATKGLLKAGYTMEELSALYKKAGDETDKGAKRVKK